jgi:iron complex outermembrane receptor protein
VSLNQKLSDNLLVYAAVRDGYKSGGFNLPGPSPEFATFEPETVLDYEIGAKTDWKVGSVPVRLNVAAFYDQYKDIQVINTVPVSDQLVSAITNSGEATIKGVEAEFTIIPVHNLRLAGFYSYTKATYGTYFQDGVNVEGEQMFFVPKVKAGGSANYTVDIGNLGGLNFGGNVSYQGKSSSPDILAPAPINKFPGYTLVNLNVDWLDILGKPVDLTVFATNVTDKEYISGGYPIYSSLGFTSAIYGEPRMVGASLRYRFGA